MDYKQKYIKYKIKYINLRNKIYGGNNNTKIILGQCSDESTGTRCTCRPFEPKIDNPNVCYKCNHYKVLHLNFIF